MQRKTFRSVVMLAGALAVPVGIVLADCHRVTFTWLDEPHSVCSAYTKCPSAPKCTGGFSTGLDNQGALGNYTVNCEDYVNGTMKDGQCWGGTSVGPSTKVQTFTNQPICSTKACP